MCKIKYSHIGILGLGSRSTLFYIKQLNETYQEINGGFSTCPFILLNTDFNKINAFLPNKFEDIKGNLLPYLNKIQKFNIETLIVPNITLHQTMDMLTLDTNVRLIHPIKSTVNLLVNKNEKEITLFGSLYSMNDSYIRNYFVTRAIKVSIPIEPDMKFIDDLRQKIYLNKESQEEINQYRKLVNRYSMNKSVVIACTELSIFSQDMNTKVYDMANIQINNVLNK